MIWNLCLSQLHQRKQQLMESGSSAPALAGEGEQKVSLADWQCSLANLNKSGLPETAIAPSMETGARRKNCHNPQ